MLTDSLRTGKLTGNFAKFGVFRAVLALADAKSHSDLNSLREIPCSCRNRESFSRNREFFAGVENFRALSPEGHGTSASTLATPRHQTPAPAVRGTVPTGLIGSTMRNGCAAS
jgi:hypothetical protein